MVEILRRYGLDRMLVNSAADWGNSDPLKTRTRRRDDARRGLHATTTSTGCCGATPSSSTARAGGSSCPRRRRRSAERARRRRRDVHGQLHAPRREGVSRAPPPPRRPDRPPRLLHQRPPGRGPRHDHRAARPLRPARAPPPRRATASASACGWRPGRRAASPTTRRADRPAARRARRARPRGRHPQRLPLPRLPGRGGQAPRLPPGLDRAGPPRLHDRPRRGARRPAARRRRRGSISTLPLGWRTRGSATGRSLAAEQLDRLADRLDALRRAHRPRDPRRPRARARLRHRDDDRAVDRMAGWDEDGSASASTSATSPSASRTRPSPCPRLAAAGRRVVKAQVSAALHVEHPGDRGHPQRARRLRRAPLPAPDPLAGHRASGQLRAPTTSARPSAARAPSTRARAAPAPWRVHFHVPLTTPPSRRSPPRPATSGTRSTSSSAATPP